MGSCQTSKGGPTTPGGWTEAKSSCDLVASSGVCVCRSTKTYLYGFWYVLKGRFFRNNHCNYVNISNVRMSRMTFSKFWLLGWSRPFHVYHQFYRGDLQAEGASSQDQVGQCSWGAVTLPRDGKGAMLTSLNLQRSTSPDLTSQTEVYFSRNHFKLVKYGKKITHHHDKESGMIQV